MHPARRTAWTVAEIRATRGDRLRRTATDEMALERSVNQEVAGSSPARGANYYREFCSAPTVSTDSCVEACAEAEAGSELVRPSRRLTAVRRCSGARWA